MIANVVSMHVTTMLTDGLDDTRYENYSYIEDTANLNDYLWYIGKSSNSEKYFCTIENIILSSVWADVLQSLFNACTHEQRPRLFLLMGKLVPCENSKPALLIKLAVPSNSWFFYLDEYSAASKGCFWFKDHGGTWYNALGPHPSLYGEAYQEVVDAICNTLATDPLHQKKNIIEIYNAFLCNRDWNWVELDPYFSPPLVGIFIHGEISLSSTSASMQRRVSIRIPITEMFLEYFNCLSANDSPCEVGTNIHWYSAIYDTWFIVKSVDEDFKSTYNAFLQRAEIGHILRIHKMKQTKLRAPVVTVMLDSLIDQKTKLQVSTNFLISAEVQSSYLVALVRIQEYMSCSLHAFFPIVEFFVDMGKGKTGPTAYLKTRGNLYLRICCKDSTKPSKFSPEALNILINKYNWPSSIGSQIWRHIGDFRCYFAYEQDNKKRNGSSGHIKTSSNNSGNSANEFVSVLEFIDNKKYQPLIMGKLLPPVGSKLLPLSVLTHVRKYSIDYGLSLDDNNRGLWVEAVIADTWYKLIPPAHPTFQRIADQDFYLVHELLSFADLIQQVNNSFGITFDKQTGLIVIPFPVKELFRRLKGKINLRFLQEHAEFALSNLDVIISRDKSKEFFRSIISLKYEDIDGWIVANKKVLEIVKINPSNSSSFIKSSSKNSSTTENSNNNCNYIGTTNAEPSSTISSDSEKSLGPSTIGMETEVNNTKMVVDDGNETLLPLNIVASIHSADNVNTISTNSSPQERPLKDLEMELFSESNEFYSDVSNHTAAAASSKMSNNENTDDSPLPKKIKRKDRSEDVMENEQQELVSSNTHTKRLKNDKRETVEISTGFMVWHSLVSPSNSCATNTNAGSVRDIHKVFPNTSDNEDDDKIIAAIEGTFDLNPICEDLHKLPSCLLSICSYDEELKRDNVNYERDKGIQRQCYEKHLQNRSNFLSGSLLATTGSSPSVCTATTVSPKGATTSFGSWGKSSSTVSTPVSDPEREEFQGRIVDVSSVDIESVSTITTGTVPRSALKTLSLGSSDPPEPIVSKLSSRRDYLQSIRSKRQALRKGKHSSKTSILMWQDEDPEHNKVLGHRYLIDQVDLSPMLNFEPTTTISIDTDDSDDDGDSINS